MNVSVSSGCSSVSPLGETPSQLGSDSGENLSARSPVLETAIWYSIVCPSSAVSSSPVNAVSVPSTRWAFSIVNSGSSCASANTWLDCSTTSPLCAVASLVQNSPAFASVCSQVNVWLSSTSISVLPAGEMFVHLASWSGERRTGMSPVFCTMISYSTVWPAVPRRKPVVKSLSLPLIRWSFSTENSGSSACTITSLDS